MKESLPHAEELKLEGNVHFKAGQWDEALVSYRTALACLPVRKGRGKGKETQERNPPSDDEEEGTDIPKETEIRESEELESNDEGQAEYAKARAVMNANIGACHVKLVSQLCAFPKIGLEFGCQGDHKEAVKSCTEGK